MTMVYNKNKFVKIVKGLQNAAGSGAAAQWIPSRRGHRRTARSSPFFRECRKFLKGCAPMHELALIESLVAMVIESARENGIRRVARVGLVVGEAYGALPEALAFAFSCLTPDTPLDGAELKMEIRPLRMRCPACGADFSPPGWRPVCPQCGVGPPEVIQGRELYLDYFEGD